MGKVSLVTASLIFSLSLATSITSLAGSWQQEENNWRYKEDDGSYATNKWIESSTEKGCWYYVDANGNMLVNATTPDGFTVNSEGEWRETTAATSMPTVDAGTVKYEPQEELKKFIGQYKRVSRIENGVSVGLPDKGNYMKIVPNDYGITALNEGTATRGFLELRSADSLFFRQVAGLGEVGLTFEEHVITYHENGFTVIGYSGFVEEWTKCGEVIYTVEAPKETQTETQVDTSHMTDDEYLYDYLGFNRPSTSNPYSSNNHSNTCDIVGQ